MDTRHPHEIKDLSELSKAERKRYVPLTEAEASKLREKTPEQRAAWLAFLNKAEMARRRRGDRR